VKNCIRYREENYIIAQDVELPQQFVKEFVFHRENIGIFSSEASRCEAIIFSILREVYKNYCHQYPLWIQKPFSYGENLN
jgi:hypothetical protein